MYKKILEEIEATKPIFVFFFFAFGAKCMLNGPQSGEVNHPLKSIL